MNESVLNRVSTLDYLHTQLLAKKRIVVSRYSDGEYLMMSKLPNNTHDVFDVLPSLLERSIAVKGQFVCVNYLKPHNVGDRWAATQKFLIEKAQKVQLGCCNWNIYDFQNNNLVLPSLFSGKVLLLTAYAAECAVAFKCQPNLKIYEVPTKNASLSYKKILSDLINIGSNYDNIIFCCGPIGKVLLADLIPYCQANLIDLGSLINALVNEYSKGTPLIKNWTMSWAHTVDLKSKSKDFFSKLREDC